MENVKSAIATGLSNFAVMHHSFGTRFIASCLRDSAISVTYYTTSHYFEAGDTGGVRNGSDVLYATERYKDSWENQRDGSLLIVNRNLVC